jgi:hypothetical protein
MNPRFEGLGSCKGSVQRICFLAKTWVLEREEDAKD